VSSKYVTERQDFCQEIISLSFFSYFLPFFQKIIVNLKNYAIMKVGKQKNQSKSVLSAFRKSSKKGGQNDH
jgi:hypothetical protein